MSKREAIETAAKQTLKIFIERITEDVNEKISKDEDRREAINFFINSAHGKKFLSYALGIGIYTIADVVPLDGNRKEFLSVIASELSKVSE